jgi:NlpC/P60 family
MAMRIWALAGAAALFPATLVALPLLAVMARGGVMGGVATADTVPGIPAVLLDAYNQAAMRTPSVDPGCTGMRWSILAGIGMAESSQAAGHQISPDGQVTPPIYGVPLSGSGAGGNTAPVYSSGGYARALGPMQILPSTWAQWKQWGRRGYGTPDPQNVYDAALTAAAILCGGGTRNLDDPAQLAAAILSYNHSQAYVAEVESWITTYGQMASTAGSGRPGQAGPVAQKVIAFAEQQIGKPYLWGGTGPAAFDCSGLTMMAYRAAGIGIPRTSQAQWVFGRQIPASQVQPGDLLFYPGSRWHHDPTRPRRNRRGKRHNDRRPVHRVDVRQDRYTGAENLVGFTQP